MKSNENLNIVVDASVLVDMFIRSSPRHTEAVELAGLVQNQHCNVIIPMHAVLELKCAIDCERLKSPSTLSNNVFPEDAPLKFTQIAIDQNFLGSYSNLSVPYMKAGDLPYVLIAKKHAWPLITEDNGQYKGAKASGVAAYKINEFLKNFPS